MMDFHLTQTLGQGVKISSVQGEDVPKRSPGSLMIDLIKTS